MVADAGRLLHYAVSQGLIVDTTIIASINGMEDLIVKKTTPTPDNISGFLVAYNSLSKLTDGVSGESLSGDAERDGTNTTRLYISLLIILLVILIPITTATIVGNQLVKAALEDIEWVCNNEEILDCRQQKPETALATSVKPSQGFIHLYETSVRAARTYNRLVLVAKINFMKPPEWDSKVNDLKTNFWNTRYQGDNIIAMFNLIYGTVAGCLLPILFAMLGAVTFGLRDLRQHIEAKTWIKQGQAIPVLRLAIAGLSGFIISFFSDFTAKSGLSPMAVAFVVGYSVDVFFAFLDTVVTRLRAPASPPKTA